MSIDPVYDLLKLCRRMLAADTESVVFVRLELGPAVELAERALVAQAQWMLDTMRQMDAHTAELRAVVEQVTARQQPPADEVPQPTWVLLPDAVAMFVASADETRLAALERAVRDQRCFNTEGPPRLRDDEMHLADLLRKVDP